MKIYVLTFTNIQNNDKQVEVYPTLKLAQIHMKGKVDDAIAQSNTPDLIADENDYMCYVKDVCEATIEISYVSFHDFIAHKIVEHYCENVVEASLYYDVIYDVVCGFETSEYPDIDDYESVQRFIDHKLHNTMSFAAAKKLTSGIGLSYEKFNKVVSYLHDNVGLCHLAKISNGEMITQYQIKYDIDHPKEPLFKLKKVWAFSSCMYGGGSFSPDYFEFRLFDKYDDAFDALVAKKNDISAEFALIYGKSDVVEDLFEDPNSTTYKVYEKENHDDLWVGNVETKYIE